MKKWIVAAVAAAAVAGGAALVWHKVHGPVDKTVAQPYVEKDLTVDEIRAKLKSKDFKGRVEAGKQIDKLEPEERLRVLLKLADDADTPARVLAVKKLRLIDDARAKDRLRKMAKDDPDSDVRDLAASKP